MNDESSSLAYSGPVTELAVRRLNASQDVTSFAADRDRFINVLRRQPGVRTDREFAAFFDFSTFSAPDPAVFVGMTQYHDGQAFAAVGESLGSSPEAGAFFSTFTPLVFTALRPLDPEDHYELADIAAAPGQVLEIAHRDLSAYPDLADYDSKRRAFLTALREQEGFVAEYQWASVLESSIAVGMTVYESGEAFQSLAMSPFAQSAASIEFLTAYPPVTGFVSMDARV